MALRVDVDKRELDKLASNLRKAAKATPQEVDKALLKAGNEVEKAIRKDTDVYMPKGYEQVFKRSLIITVKLHKGGATRSVSLTGRAFGRRGNDRQVEQLEKGRLKHPFWGRWVNKPSAWQKIKPGWMSEPARKATPRVVLELDKAAKRIGDKIGEGL